MNHSCRNEKLDWVADKVESIDSKIDRLLEIAVVNRAKIDWHNIQLQAIWIAAFTATGGFVAYLINHFKV